MAINYELVRQKVNELNLTAIKIVDTLGVLERGTITIPPPNSVTLTSAQIASLNANLEIMGNTLKIIAGEIKELVKQ